MYYLELDLGKPTFSLPQFVSLIKFTKPTFANSPFSILMKDELVYSKYIGENTPVYTESRYINAIEDVVKILNSLQKGSRIVINYHGFNKGFGNILRSQIER